ncbi:MAG: exodeoxyribonuclease III [Candidatus Magasanikbacteria bacterium CG11_big_fil_rev_8_21_14_0_20_39_34]|uniref:Exodeoxyribonuclease III n=1 Tax=Candidatus Magasanikbacteria bacterium CG11_big_fil_rev_8_21_14_0_20_39_34 TaxID=1974653 RepID=A0A2H0N614_9BACT|nr:MAG: exodeoxyribonuclease III [Candidatus Magasanikbacteria bacterium CG11_big_fil_rev_8_21_14_0_20_39_34]
MKKQTLTIISWNVNGLRAVIRKKLFLPFIQKYHPDILCLQETKAQQDQVEIDLPDYTEYWHSAEKKGYSGTAIFSQKDALNVIYGIPSHIYKKSSLLDDQNRDANLEGRVIVAEYEKFFLANVYTPNAKDDLSRLELRYKQWDPIFLRYMKFLEEKKPVIFCGDLNVAHQEIDLARPKQNVGVHGFTNEERERFQDFLDAGFIDTYRDKHADTLDAYTWWSHWGTARARNVGWRIDYVLTSQSMKKNIKEAFILPEVMGSDHCPVGIVLKL